MNMVDRICGTCRCAFLAKASEVARGDGRFCSVPCAVVGPTPTPLEERFRRRVDVNGPIPEHRPDLGPCHIWQGPPSRHGYGAFRVGSRRDGTSRVESPHRVAWFLAHGAWPTLHVCHKCDRPLCVNPAHHFEGDDKANVADRESKGRGGEAKRIGTLNGQAKLTDEAVRKIRVSALSQRALARLYGVSRPVIKAVLRGETWRHVS